MMVPCTACRTARQHCLLSEYSRQAGRFIQLTGLVSIQLANPTCTEDQTSGFQYIGKSSLQSTRRYSLQRSVAGPESHSYLFLLSGCSSDLPRFCTTELTCSRLQSYLPLWLEPLKSAIHSGHYCVCSLVSPYSILASSNLNHSVRAHELMYSFNCAEPLPNPCQTGQEIQEQYCTTRHRSRQT